MIDSQKIKKIDKSDAYGSITYLSNQINQVIDEVAQLQFPHDYSDRDIVAISGMGGSIYSYYVIASLFHQSLKKPLIAVNDYHLPSYLTERTLFIGSSYSGSTEETIFTTQEAVKKNCAVTAITSGGKLSELMKKNNLSYLHFNPQFNPSKQPRIGIGYMIFGTTLLLDLLGYLNINKSELRVSLDHLKSHDEVIQEKALGIKDKIKNTVIIFVGAEHLSGTLHIARNQINETAKAFAEYHIIPELNHHLMEGLTYPKDKKLLFVFYNSPFYYERNQKRVEVTKKVLKQQKIPYLDVSFEAENILEEFLFYLQFGSYLSFFLGIDYGVDPSKIPWVDYFKKELAK